MHGPFKTYATNSSDAQRLQAFTVSPALLAWLCLMHGLLQFLCQTLHSFGTIALLPLLCKTDSFTLHKAAACMESSTVYGLGTALALLFASLKPALDCCCR